ncbi:MAG: hypothetical protein L0Y71_01425 [Gemmataceae bacterium]|nr:hypothetical protein [Gemmataceae bacterium]
MEFGIGITLATILVVVAVYFGWRQRSTLAQLRHDVHIAPEDRLYYVRQIRRRLICSVLLVLLAGMVVGWFLLNRDVAALRPAAGEPLTEEAKASIRFIATYWIVALGLVLVILVLACFDFMATARFGMRRMRQLENDRRTILEMEAAKLRRRRQEMN